MRRSILHLGTKVLPVVLAIILPPGAVATHNQDSDSTALRIVKAADIRLVAIGSRTVHPPMLTATPQGAMYVIDEASATITGFTRANQQVAHFSSISAPSPWFVGAMFTGMHGDSIWITDPRTNRLLLIPTDGSPPRALPLLFRSGGVGLSSGFPIAVLQDGSYLLEYSYGGEMLEQTGIIVPVNVGKRDGQTSSTLTSLEVLHPRWAIPNAGGTSYLYYQPFSDDPLFAVSSGGEFAVRVDRRLGADSAQAFGVTCFDLGTGERSKVSIPFQPVLVTQDSITSALSRGAEILMRLGIFREAAASRRWVHLHMYAPQSYPPALEVFVGVDGSIALRVPSDSSDSTSWLIRDCKTGKQARLSLPQGINVQQVSSNSIWALEFHDNTSEWHAVRFDFPDWHKR